MLPFFYDWTFLLLIPGLILSFWAQSRISSAFSKYSKVPARAGVTGQEMARQILLSEGVGDVAVEVADGALSDHYDPSAKALRLSRGVATSTSVAALSVAAHEAGHALQHRDAYGPLILRSAAVPAANIGSNLSWPLFLAGLIFRWEPLMTAGIVLFAAAVVFTLISLPVEFNASRRAMAVLDGHGYLAQEELPGARRVLNAAALTYVAAALTALLQLVRLLALSGRRRD